MMGHPALYLSVHACVLRSLCKSAILSFMKTVHADIPDQLYGQLQSLIAEGWFRNEADLLQEALRCFLEAHQPELMERFVRQDVEWGIHGRD